MPSSSCPLVLRDLHAFPTRRSSDLTLIAVGTSGSKSTLTAGMPVSDSAPIVVPWYATDRLITLCLVGLPVSLKNERATFQADSTASRSEEHTSELQSLRQLVCRLLPAPSSSATYTLSLHDALPILP